jgi:hypothetical protein
MQPCAYERSESLDGAAVESERQRPTASSALGLPGTRKATLMRTAR